MPKEWSSHILISDLADEPALSEELASLLHRIASAPDGESRTNTMSDVVLNFAGVSYLNSSNIAQLLQVRDVVQRHGRSLLLCALRDEVWSVMLMTGLDKVFRFAPDPASAIASIQITGDHEGE